MTDTGEISAAEAARRLGLTDQAVGQWAAKPGAPVRRQGTRVYVRWPDFARWREQELVAGAKKEAPAGSNAERRSAAEARSAEIALELREIELAERLGQVVAVEDYGRALGTILDQLSARLRGLGPRLARFGPEVEAAVEAEAERVITELHAWDDDVLDEEPAATETEATT